MTQPLSPESHFEWRVRLMGAGAIIAGRCVWVRGWQMVRLTVALAGLALMIRRMAPIVVELHQLPR